MVTPMKKTALRGEMVNNQPFQLDSISKVDSPDGSAGDWQRYVISQGTNTITGVRAGDHAEVSLVVAELVQRLNERRLGKTRPKTKPATPPRAAQ
jgi:hypothetical protein